MTRDLAPCGTAAAYRRHNRRGELVDEACRLAARAAEAARRRAATGDGEGQGAVLRIHPEFARGISAETRAIAQEHLVASLTRVERAMDAVEPSQLVGLSERHSELVSELVALEPELANV